MTSSHRLDAVRAAALDGRAQTIYYKLDQLEKLRDALAAEAGAILEVMSRDSGASRAENKVEFALAMLVLRRRYSELEAGRALEDEYRIANGVNAPDRRLGPGIVVIEPCLHTAFFSLIAPLVGAIAGGNVIVVQMENSTRRLPTLLKSIISTALDHDSIAFVTEPVRLDTPHLVIAQRGTVNTALSCPSHHIASPSDSRAVAIVDRDADFDAAALTLANARFAHGGRSPHAPDIVLVNEFVKDRLLQALVRVGIGAAERPSATKKGLDSTVTSLQRSHGARIVAQGDSTAILDLPAGGAALPTAKVGEPVLVVRSVTSLDDAIDKLTTSSGPFLYLAGYFFGTPATGKYLSQFIPSQVSFINHIPPEILVGPAFPYGHAVDPHDRYPAALFTVPSPAFVGPPVEHGQLLEPTAVGAPSDIRDAAAQAFFSAALTPLAVAKRQKQLNAGFGYFEQAFDI
ncbi:hypothetical protein ANO11243_056790 [Dothideomycetidae sp. 11243]|nr:hypothetical protein ANO11243_056790 [fungal sp. No.11243]